MILTDFFPIDSRRNWEMVY